MALVNFGVIGSDATIKIAEHWTNRDGRATSIRVAYFEPHALLEEKELQGLIRTALEKNYDLRDAVARIDVARAGLGIARSSRFPNLGAG